MKSLSFRKDLVGVQDELLRFAYKLTTDREEANDLLQETSLKALDSFWVVFFYLLNLNPAFSTKLLRLIKKNR